MTTKPTARGGNKGKSITSQKQQVRRVLLNDLMMTQYRLDECRHPQVRRGLAVLAGLIESKLKDVEKIRSTH